MKLSLKRLLILLAIGLPLAAAIYTAVFWNELQYGLKLPGIVGTAADRYFYDGSKMDDEVAYCTFMLKDDSEWKAVMAHTNGKRSIPSWLIFILQGPDRQTYVFEGRFDYSKMMNLHSTFGDMIDRENDQVRADQNAQRSIHDDPRYFALYSSVDSQAFEATLLDLGFRKTSY